MPRGASPKREHEYKELEHQFEQEGRYPGREEEVAARIVNQQRAETGESGGTGESRQQPGRTGTGHRRRNTTRRNKAS